MGGYCFSVNSFKWTFLQQASTPFLCLSDYHPDTWNPAWSVATILTGLLSFMLEKSPTLGSVETTEAEKRRLAAASHGRMKKPLPAATFFRC